MCSPTAATVGMMAVGAGTQAMGARNQAKVARDQAEQEEATLRYQAQVDENNAQIAEWQWQDAIRQGHQRRGHGFRHGYRRTDDNRLPD